MTAPALAIYDKKNKFEDGGYLGLKYVNCLIWEAHLFTQIDKFIQNHAAMVAAILIGMCDVHKKKTGLRLLSDWLSVRLK